MRAALRVFPLVFAGLVLCACASAGGTGNSTGSYDVLTREQLTAAGEVSMMEAIQKLRPNWLSKRGLTTTQVTQQQLPESDAGREVMIMLDGSKLGGPNTLHTIRASTITSARHFDGLSATARWGICCGAGVVYLETTARKAAP